MTLATSVRRGVIPCSTTPNQIQTLRMSNQQRFVKSAGVRLVAPASAARAYCSSSARIPRSRPQNSACRPSVVGSDSHGRLPLPDSRSACAPTLFTTGAANSTSSLLSPPLLVTSGDSAHLSSSPSQLSRPFSTQCRARPTATEFSASPSSVPRRRFSRSYPAMVAQKLDGNAIAKTIREKLATEIAEKQKANPRYKPCLKIIQGMHRTASFKSALY